MNSEQGLGLRRHGNQLVSDSDATALERVAADGEELVGEVVAAGRMLVSAVDTEPAEPWLCCALEMVSVAELVTIIVGATHTGALVVRSGANTRRLYFENGQFTGAQSDLEEDRIGEVLWRTEKISLDQKVIAEEYEKDEPGKTRALIELGFVSPRDLRQAQRQRAQWILNAACLWEQGSATFLGGAYLRAPVRFGRETESLVDAALAQFHELQQLKDKLAPLDEPAVPKIPAPSGHCTEGEDAMLQLAASAHTPLTRQELIDRSGLGAMSGMRALAMLIERGYFDFEVAKPAATQPPRLERLATAIDLCTKALNDAGFGALDEVREWIENPVGEVADSLSGLSLDGPLDVSALRIQSTFLDGGVPQMEAALEMLLDFALFEAEATLEADACWQLASDVQALQVM